MSGSEHARPIWLTKRHYELTDTALALIVRRGYLAAPADSEEVVGATLEAEFEVEITDEHLAVLRALGHPEDTHG